MMDAKNIFTASGFNQITGGTTPQGLFLKDSVE